MLCHPLCTLHDARRRAPCNTRYRLTGCVFAGQESNPLARVERFQIMFSSFPSFSFPGLGLEQCESSRRALRGIALGRKSWLFCGSDRGGVRAAAMYTLIGTAKLNNVDPQAWARRCPRLDRRNAAEQAPRTPSVELDPRAAARTGCIGEDPVKHFIAGVLSPPTQPQILRGHRQMLTHDRPAFALLLRAFRNLAERRMRLISVHPHTSWSTMIPAHRTKPQIRTLGHP